VRCLSLLLTLFCSPSLINIGGASFKLDEKGRLEKLEETFQSVKRRLSADTSNGSLTAGSQGYQRFVPLALIYCRNFAISNAIS